MTVSADISPLFKQMVEHLPVPAAIFDTAMCYLFANEWWVKNFRIEGQPVIGRCHYDVFPEISAEWKATHQRCLQGEIHREKAVAFRRLDGSTSWLRREIRPWYADDGTIGGLIIYAEDITDSRETQLALERQHRFLRQVIDLNTSFVFAKDRDGRFTLVNRALADAYGSTPEEMVGKYDEDYNPIPNETYHFKRDDLEVLRTRTPKFIAEEAVTHVGDGKTRWYQTTKVPLIAEPGADAQLLGIATDITDRKQAQDDLRAQHRFLRQVIDLNTSFIFAKDEDGCFTLVNQALADAYGSTPEAMVGKSDCDYNPDPEQVVNIRRDDMEVLRTRTPRFIPQEPITNARTGETRWYQTIKVPIIGLDGQAQQLLGVATDITDRKQAEEQLQQLVIQEQQARQAAEAASRMRDLFLANMSHELRTPLHAIIGFLREIFHSGQLDDDNIHMVERCLANSRRLSLLIDSLLDLSRLAVGSLELVVTPVNLNELGRFIGDDVGLQVRAKSLGFALEIDPALPDSIQHDEERLTQIITNLLLNAIKYTDAGEVRLTLRHHPAGRLHIKVADTGIGIAPDMHAHIFESFSQGDTGRQKEGVGLGLSIVKNLVQLMGGMVFLESEVGAYTIFTVDLPLNLPETDGMHG